MDTEAVRARLDVVIVQRLAHRVASMDRFTAAMLANTADPTIYLRPFDPAKVPWPCPQSRAGDLTRRWLGVPAGLARFGGDILHIVDHSDAHLLRVAGGRKTVVTCHDLMLLKALAGEVPYQGKQRWARRFQWTVRHLRLADAVACPSEATREDVLRFLHLPSARVHVIPQGIGNHFRPGSAEQREATRATLTASGQRLVLSIGSGGFYKNTEGLLRVFAAVRARSGPLVLVRVGVPFSPSERALATDLGLDDSIAEVGRVSEGRLIELYQAADALLFPSSAEGFGWPVLEAMSTGLPVVCSNIPPLVDLVGPNALTAAPADHAGLTNHLDRLLRDADLAERVRADGLRRATQFSWEQVLEQYRNLYTDIGGGSTVK